MLFVLTIPADAPNACLNLELACRQYVKTAQQSLRTASFAPITTKDAPNAKLGTVLTLQDNALIVQHGI